MRETEGDRDIQTDRETDRKTARETEGDIDIQRDTKRDRER